MAGGYIKPKAYNRRFAINIGVPAAPIWAEIAQGIASRGNSISESTEDFYYMAGRGTAETETTGQKISRTFTGNRFIGDRAQDAIFMERLYNMDLRNVEYLEWYDNLTGDDPNGYKGNATITISDDGSGDASNRETIGFGLSYNGLPTRGTVTVSDEGEIAFASATA